MLHSASSMNHGWMAALGVAAMAWVTAAGCGSTVIEGEGCPADPPGLTTACSAAGTTCDYPDVAGCVSRYACGDDKLWAFDSSTCEPVDCWNASDGDYCAVVGDNCGEIGECGGFENQCTADHTWSTIYYDDACCYGPAECPVLPPQDGDPCDPCTDAGYCTYPTNCGEAVASCSYDGSWVVMPGECTPPLDPCAQILDEVNCTSDPACRWLAPGCGTPALPAPGCFPQADCTPGSCIDPGTTCQTVIHDPCYNKGCAVCSAEVSVCLP